MAAALWLTTLSGQDKGSCISCVVCLVLVFFVLVISPGTNWQVPRYHCIRFCGLKTKKQKQMDLERISNFSCSFGTNILSLLWNSDVLVSLMWAGLSPWVLCFPRLVETNCDLSPMLQSDLAGTKDLASPRKPPNEWLWQSLSFLIIYVYCHFSLNGFDDQTGLLDPISRFQPHPSILIVHWYKDERLCSLIPLCAVQIRSRKTDSDF